MSEKASATHLSADTTEDTRCPKCRGTEIKPVKDAFYEVIKEAEK